MNYYIKRDEIFDAQQVMVTSINKWLSQLVKVKAAMKMFVNSGAITGAAADSIRAYVNEEPIPIIDAMISCIKFFYVKMMVCTNGYGDIDDNAEAHINVDWLESIFSELDNRGNCFHDSREAISGKLNSVSDIFTIGAPLNRPGHDFENLKERVNNLKSDVSDYETSHLHDMDDIKNILLALADALKEALNKTPIYISSYEKGQIPCGEIQKNLFKQLIVAGGIIKKDMNLSYEYRIINFITNNPEYGNHFQSLMQYAYLHPESADKVRVIIDYELDNPDDMKNVYNFLKPMEIQDQIEICYIAYSTDEPYRSEWIKYLDDYEIATINYKSTSRFIANENAIYVNIEKERENERGAYYTFFHECGHAVDYNSGIEAGYGTFYSNKYTDVGKQTLAEHNVSDVRNELNNYLDEQIASGKYSDFGQDAEAAKDELIDRLVRGQEPPDSELCEQMLDDLTQEYNNNRLLGPVNNVASDIYGGVTNNAINGSYGHGDDYWYDDSGNWKNPTNKECFAEYFSYHMLKKEDAIDSINTYLPESDSFMDEMVSSIASLDE